MKISVISRTPKLGEISRESRLSAIREAKTKALISFAVTAKLICAFVFVYADCWFSHEAAHMLNNILDPRIYSALCDFYLLFHLFYLYSV